MSINQVAITGNLTRDPEVRATQSGSCVMSISVAINDRRRDPKTGEWEDVPNFVDVTMFGNRVQALSNLLAKGAKVAVSGKLRWQQLERDGEKRSKLDVVADELEFLSAPKAE